VRQRRYPSSEPDLNRRLVVTLTEILDEEDYLPDMERHFVTRRRDVKLSA
jgi:hypothetical protein